MRKVVAMYEKEEAYGRQLAEYLNRKDSIPFEILVFSEENKLTAYLQGHKPELLLLSEGCRIPVDCYPVMFLSDQKPGQEETDIIYKYQSAEGILHSLMVKMNCKEKTRKNDEELSCAVYGVYSPVGRCGKTTFALLLGEILAKNKSVLYLGFDEIMPTGELNTGDAAGTLSDAYFYIQSDCLGEKVRALTCHWHELDILSGVAGPEDLQSIQAAEWCELVEKIAQKAGYDAIVLDLGTKLWLAVELFSLCSRIYVPTLEDSYAEQQQACFEQWLNRDVNHVLRDYVYRINIPRGPVNTGTKNWLEYELWGETGDYIRNLIKGEW